MHNMITRQIFIGKKYGSPDLQLDTAYSFKLFENFVTKEKRTNPPILLHSCKIYNTLSQPDYGKIIYIRILWMKEIQKDNVKAFKKIQI